MPVRDASTVGGGLASYSTVPALLKHILRNILIIQIYRFDKENSKILQDSCSFEGWTCECGGV